jgi:glyoxylase-like metal-dependent hydrolase (beta-lactamase superfamily II)
MSQQQISFGPVTVVFGEKNGKYPDGNSVLIRGTDTTVLIDPSMSISSCSDAELPAVDLVLQSHVHEDHVAGVHRFPDAQIFAHRDDARGLRSLAGMMEIYGYQDLEGEMEKFLAAFNYAPRPDVREFEDGAVFELGGTSVRAIHLPGHTRGHSALLVEPQGVLFLGDIDLSSFGPYYGDAWSCMTDFEDSLRRLRGIEAKVWVTFHHVGAIQDPAVYRERLNRFEARIGEREQAMLEFLHEPHSLAEMVKHRFIYPAHATATFIDTVEAHSIGQHLDRLVTNGRVTKCEPDKFRAVA